MTKLNKLHPLPCPQCQTSAQLHLPPIMSEAAVSTNLLETFEVFTDLAVKNVGQRLAVLAILDVVLSVKEPVRDLVLTRVRHHRYHLLNLISHKHTSTLVTYIYHFTCVTCRSPDISSDLWSIVLHATHDQQCYSKAIQTRIYRYSDSLTGCIYKLDPLRQSWIAWSRTGSDTTRSNWAYCWQ